MFDCFADRFTLKEWSAAKNNQPPSILSVPIEETKCNHVAGVSCIVEDELTRSLVYAGWCTEWNSPSTVLRVAHIVVDRAFTCTLQIYVFEIAVGQALHNTVLEPHVMDLIAVRVLDAPVFTVPAAIFCQERGWEMLPQTGKDGKKIKAKMKAINKTS